MLRSSSDGNMSANWGNNLRRTDLRPRPNSSGTTRNLNEKAPFLSHPVSIGRNFDEDECKPLDRSINKLQLLAGLSPSVNYTKTRILQSQVRLFLKEEVK